MGICFSSRGMVDLTEEDKRRHKEAEKFLRDAKARMASQVKVLLLGSGDSGKSTILKQMRLIHRVPFSSEEIENYRQLVFNNLTTGMNYVFEAMEDMGLEVAEEILPHVDLIKDARDIQPSQPFPPSYYGPLKSLWEDKAVQQAYGRGNEAALPENLSYFFPALDRLFHETYKPTEQDIVQCRARTIGITETTFQLKDHEMLMVDVGGQKSERRKWIHCFQDVTSILFLVSLSGYDQCLVEDRDANQMQDAMTIWDSICHSQWFKQTSIILFLNKDDLFQKKIRHSDIKNFFPDFEGEPGDAKAGRDYFRRRFTRLAQKAGRSKEREIYIHVTTATDTAMLRVVMAAVEVPLLARISAKSCYDALSVPDPAAVTWFVSFRFGSWREGRRPHSVPSECRRSSLLAQCSGSRGYCSVRGRNPHDSTKILTTYVHLVLHTTCYGESVAVNISATAFTLVLYVPFNSFPRRF